MWICSGRVEMIRIALALLIVLAISSSAVANWQVYSKKDKIIASLDYVTFASFRNQPSVWVRWHNVSKKARYGGRKIQFTADCASHRLFEINSVPYDHAGIFLAGNPMYDSPKEYPLKNNDLNKATYRLLCK
jgi:hypothetical protein